MRCQNQGLCVETLKHNSGYKIKTDIQAPQQIHTYTFLTHAYTHIHTLKNNKEGFFIFLLKSCDYFSAQITLERQGTQKR